MGGEKEGLNIEGCLSACTLFIDVDDQKELSKLAHDLGTKSE